MPRFVFSGFRLEMFNSNATFKFVGFCTAPPSVPKEDDIVIATEPISTGFVCHVGAWVSDLRFGTLRVSGFRV